MISAPRRGRPFWLAAIALLAGAASPGEDFLAKGREALAKGDGISAEVALRRALAAGVPREAVAAYMGEALLDQEAPDKAREWLEPGAFTRDTAALGFRHLAQLERTQGNLAAAGEAFDQAMAITPRDATMWVEIGRLRYVGGEHVLAIEAADYALTLDPDSVRALEFKGQLVRDSQGLTAGLPWFERALQRHPRDIAVLGEYAATLGDLGRAKKMLEVTRQMLAIEPGNPRAYFLQAVMAARAGNTELARGLLARTKDEFDETPAGQLLDGVLEMEAGNYVLAAEALQKLARAQPGNARAAQLLARAYALGGENGLVVHDNADAAARPEASPFMLTLVARAYECDGRRDLAAPLLDRAAQAQRTMLSPIVAGSEVGALLAAGNVEEARRVADSHIATNPGSAFNQTIAGDVRLAAGDGVGALEHYRLAAYVRLSQSTLLRTVAASTEAGQGVGATGLVEAFLAANPNDPVAARMAAGEAAATGDWRRARLLLEHVRDNSGASDTELLADLSLAQLRSGNPKAAEATARAAYALQRASPVAAHAWGLSLDALGRHIPAQALLAKSRGTFAER
ncbi:tetratricopeptide repeat protein [Novosphingobium sp. G106]|uniref:tetratricopeptide repeat protein n=1 Tax=Novosphingobium sp. G106 TaxID=2849500 RepID=UPI001C2D5491|nr:tetratricopeptide repeat protein [Novosphingobium sp. G106]MBV1687478.1 tetratricopeptide repeat protein [Novosphingobium sp. G106]